MNKLDELKRKRDELRQKRSGIQAQHEQAKAKKDPKAADLGSQISRADQELGAVRDAIQDERDKAHAKVRYALSLVKPVKTAEEAVEVVDRLYALVGL